jgi:hypothetical protein
MGFVSDVLTVSLLTKYVVENLFSPSYFQGISYIKASPDSDLDQLIHSELGLKSVSN